MSNTNKLLSRRSGRKDTGRETISPQHSLSPPAYDKVPSVSSSGDSFRSCSRSRSSRFSFMSYDGDKSDRFWDIFLKQSDYKTVMGRGSVISCLEAEFLLANFRNVDVEDIPPGDPAINMLQGKTKKLLRRFLLRAEDDEEIQDAFYGPVPEKIDEDLEPSMAQDDLCLEPSLSMRSLWDDDDRSEGSFVTFGYMPSVDNNEYISDEDSELDFRVSGLSVTQSLPRVDEPIAMICPNRPILAPGIHSLPVHFQGMKKTLPPPMFNAFAKEVGLPTLDINTWSQMSTTSHLLYTASETPPPDCSIAPALLVHAARSRWNSLAD